MIKYRGLALLYILSCLVRTRLLFSPARLIRFPIDIRNKSAMKWGSGFTTGKNCRLEAISPKGKEASIKIGNNVQLNDNVHIVSAESVILGDDVLIASKVFISDCSHGKYSGIDCSSPDSAPQTRPLYKAPVCIEDRVWIGDNVVVMPGVHIGAGTIIGASSVVVDSIPSDCIAVGAPARVIKKYDRIMKQWVLNEGKE